MKRFSPRNGEVILKDVTHELAGTAIKFQSPQWGSNSKVLSLMSFASVASSFSPRNGEVILK